MADRAGKKRIQAAFDYYLKAFGHRPARRYDDVGGWGLDYNPINGGLVIFEVASSTGGQHHPLGSERHSPGAFVSMLWFAIRSKEAAGRARKR
jgi:hypothetical protein